MNAPRKLEASKAVEPLHAEALELIAHLTELKRRNPGMSWDRHYMSSDFSVEAWMTAATEAIEENDFSVFAQMILDDGDFLDPILRAAESYIPAGGAA